MHVSANCTAGKGIWLKSERHVVERLEPVDSVFSVCCSVLQCVAVCCSLFSTRSLFVERRVFVYTRAKSERVAVERENQPIAVCCSVLQCVAVCCSVLQCVAVWREIEHIELPATLLDYFLRSNTSDISQFSVFDTVSFREKACFRIYKSEERKRCSRERDSAHSSVLQCVAVCCSVLQCVAVCL